MSKAARHFRGWSELPATYKPTGQEFLIGSRGTSDGGRNFQPDEDIAMLDTIMPWSSPCYKSSPTQSSRSSQIQPTPLHSFGDISFIRRPNEVIVDAFESCRRDASFGSSPSSRNLVDHSVCPRKGAASPVLGLFRLCIVSGLKPMLWAPPWSAPTLGCPFSFKLSSRHRLDLGFV